MTRWFAVLALGLLAGGCSVNQMVLDRAHLEADVPVPPPAMVPDSAERGSSHAQFVLWSMESGDSVGRGLVWSRSPVGAQLQLQVVSNPHLRWAVGAGYSRTVSVWFGPVLSVRNSLVRWDVEMLFGMTRFHSLIVGHERFEDAEGEMREGKPSSNETEQAGFWGQWTLRCRAARSGPWAELRYLPSFSWGDLASNGVNSGDLRIRRTVAAVGAGWVREMPGGSLWNAGVRGIGIGDEMFPQYLLSCQVPFGKGSR